MWSHLLVDQLDFYWKVHLWPRLDGLTDEEYLWEPAPDCLSVRRLGNAWVMERSTDGKPQVTTIAWRMMHLATEVLGNRANAFFGTSPVPDEVVMFDDRFKPGPVAGTASDAIALLERGFLHWRDGISSLDDAAMLAPLGPRGGPFAADPMAALMPSSSRSTASSTDCRRS